MKMLLIKNPGLVSDDTLSDVVNITHLVGKVGNVLEVDDNGDCIFYLLDFDGLKVWIPECKYIARERCIWLLQMVS